MTPGKKKYILPIKADKRNTKVGAVALPDSFPVLLPFRYAEIRGAKNKIKAAAVTQLGYHSFWDDTQSHFTSSDDILNQVWEMCRYSIKATTFAGLYVDGETRKNSLRSRCLSQSIKPLYHRSRICHCTADDRVLHGKPHLANRVATTCGPHVFMPIINIQAIQN